MTEEPSRNDKLLLSYEKLGSELGRKKKELAVCRYTGDDLIRFRKEVTGIVENVDENDIQEVYELALKKITGDTSDEDVGRIYYRMLDDMRAIIRRYKNELGQTISDIANREKHAGLFTLRDNKIYYKNKAVELSGQSERLFYMFIEAPDHRLTTDAIERLDDKYDVAAQRVSRLRSQLRKATGKDMIVSANKQAYRGYELKTSV